MSYPREYLLVLYVNQEERELAPLASYNEALSLQRNIHCESILFRAVGDGMDIVREKVFDPETSGFIVLSQLDPESMNFERIE